VLIFRSDLESGVSRLNQSMLIVTTHIWTRNC